MLEAFLGRSRDRRIIRPPGLAFTLDDKPPLLLTIGLALQHVAVQSTYIVLPVIIGGLMTRDIGDQTDFISLSLLAAAIWQVLQVLTSGPIGSGYPLPGTSSGANISAYALVAILGGGFAAAGAEVTIAGLVLILLTFVMHRVRVFLPNEVAGVVVILIGVALLMLSARRVGLVGTDAPPDPAAFLTVFVCLAVMAVTALSRTRAAPFAVLIGALAGIGIALALGQTVPGGTTGLSGLPWFALPMPWRPHFETIAPAPMAAFLISVVALKATALGGLVMVQRATDSSWTLPDSRPIRRGLIANGLAVILAGLIGGSCPGPAVAAAGLSVATGTLARRIVWAGAAVLVVLALCPKIVALFVLTPYPVQAAMLFYVCGFVMAQGCQLVSARLLDTRRMMIVAFGLSAGVMAAIAPHAFETWLPAIASPVSLGGLAAFLMNLVTLPLVRRRAQTVVPLDAGAEPAVAEWFGRLGGLWAMKAQTERAGHAALSEFIQILMQRGVADITLAAQRGEDRVEIQIGWPGPPMPMPSKRPSIDDLLGDSEAVEGFSVWMATRQAHGFSQKSLDGRTEATLVLED